MIIYLCIFSWKEELEDCILLQNLMINELYPNYMFLHNFLPIPHFGCFGGIWIGLLKSLMKMDLPNLFSI